MSADTDAGQATLTDIEYGPENTRTKDDWQDLYDENDGDLDAIADDAGMSETAVRAALSDHGIRASERSSLSKGDWEALYDEYGGDLAALAAETGTPGGRINDILVTHGIRERVGSEQPDMDGDDWQAAWYRKERDLEVIAEFTGREDVTVREALANVEWGGKLPPKIHLAEPMLPHEAGLKMLGCGQCGETQIVNHPCPSCGFDPRQDGDDDE